MATALKTKPQVATMNAVHDLPVLVARDEGYFKDEGLDIEFVTTPGMAQMPAIPAPIIPVLTGRLPPPPRRARRRGRLRPSAAP